MEQGKKEIKRILVTFDIDGTLIQSDGTNSNHFYQAFSYAILQVFGIHGTIDVIQPHGSTDPAILVNTLVHYGISSEVATEKLPILMSKMTEYAKAHAEDLGKGLEVLPGVESLLQTLSSMDNVIIGLVTGNLEETAWMKLDALGIKKYFSVPHFGGFGSDHMDRGHLIKIAAERAENLYPGKFDSRLHVGDTVTGNLEETAWMKLDALGIKKYFSVPHFGGFGSDHMDRGHLIKIAAERAENLYPGKFDSRLHVGDTVTGNLEETAWMKLDALGIKKYFSVPHFGGFGSDHMDRGHLIKIAAERAENLYPGKFDSRLHVGDTPNDIIAAECEGALAIGVCTGVFRKEELEQVSNRGAVILQDLCDHKSFINLLVI